MLTLVTPVFLTYYVAFLKDLFYVHTCFYFTKNDLPQAVASELLLQADDTHIVFNIKAKLKLKSN